jgi:hypothetical protein
MATTVTQAHKNRLMHNVQHLDEQYTWFLIPNQLITRSKKNNLIIFDSSNAEKARPVLVINIITSSPVGRATCFVRSASIPSSIKHYQHTRCVRTCKITRDGYLDAQFVWSVPESHCNSSTYSCTENSHSYVFDKLEKAFPWFQ